MKNKVQSMTQFLNIYKFDIQKLMNHIHTTNLVQLEYTINDPNY